MTTKNAFFFAYPRPFGEVKEATWNFPINFNEQEGYGICFRNRVDFLYHGETKLHLEIETETAIILHVEFKTEASGGCPADQISIMASKGVNLQDINIPKLLSPLKEIVVCALKQDNGDLISSYNVKTFELQ